MILTEIFRDYGGIAEMDHRLHPGKRSNNLQDFKLKRWVTSGIRTVAPRMISTAHIYLRLRAIAVS